MDLHPATAASAAARARETMARRALVDDDVSGFNGHLLPSKEVVGDDEVFLVRRIRDAQARHDLLALGRLAVDHHLDGGEAARGDLGGRLGGELDEDEGQFAVDVGDGTLDAGGEGGGSV